MAAVLGCNLLGSLGQRSADPALPRPPHPAASLPPFRRPFRRPPALNIVTSSDSIELDYDSVTPPLVGTESSDDSDGRSGETTEFAKSDSSEASVACDSSDSSVACDSGGIRSCERAPTGKGITTSSPAGQRGRRGIPAESSTADRDYAKFEDSTPSAANERPLPSPHRPRDSTSGGALGAFVGGSLRTIERTMGRAALVSGGGNKACAAPANARPRSGEGGMRSLSRGRNSSSIHHVRRNSTGAHAAGFDGGRSMVCANITSDSSDRSLPQSPGDAERPSPAWSHGLHTPETGDSFSFCHGGSSTATSSSGSGSAGGWGVGSLWRSLHAPVSPIFRPKRHSPASPWDHPATAATSSRATNPWDHHASPSTSRTNSTASCDMASNGSLSGYKGGSNGGGSTANKPPRHHQWTSMDWSHWPGPPIFSVARCPSASPRHIRFPNHIPATTSTPMHVPACPSLPGPSHGAPPLLRRSRTEGTCETSLDYAIITHDDSPSHHGGSTRDRAVSHEAWAMSVRLNEAFQDSAEALKYLGRRRTQRSASHGSFSEGCIPLVPHAVGSLAKGKGTAPHFRPATEHRLFCGLDNAKDNDPPRFRHSSTSFPRQQHPSTHQELATETPVQPEPVQKLPLQNLPAQGLLAEQLSTQQLPVQKIAAAAEVAGTGGSRMHAPDASTCDLPLHAPAASKCASLGVKGIGGQEKRPNQVDHKPPLELKGVRNQGEQHDWQPHSPTPMPRQTHRRRIRRMGSEPGFWLDHSTEADEGRGRRSREQEMGGGALERSDMIVRSPDSGWCKVGGLHSWSPEHRKGGMCSSGSQMLLVNGGDRRSEGVSMTVGLTTTPVAEGQRHVEVNSRSVQSDSPRHVEEALSEAARHTVSCNGITSSFSECLASKSGGSGGRQVGLMRPILPCKEFRGEEIQSAQCMRSVFLESGACQNWRPAMNHPLFGGRAVGVDDYLFTP
ncbi:unnamed protein product [Closterium sp. NIES-54]